LWNAIVRNTILVNLLDMQFSALHFQWKVSLTNMVEIKGKIFLVDNQQQNETIECGKHGHPKFIVHR